MPAMTTARAGRAVRHALLVAAAALAAGCSVNTEEIGPAFVAPGKYDLFSCVQILEQTNAHVARVQQLKALMDKAEQGPGGDVVAKLAYQTEYVTAYGELRVLQDTAVRKNCGDTSRSISERSLW
jgi:hypothetical protein